jgi:Fe-S cluster biogenesis protein NfuA
VRERVQEVIEEIRPMLQADGGDVELVDVTDQGVVKVRLTGACGGCPMSQITLSRGIESRLKASVPEVVRVESVPRDEIS